MEIDSKDINFTLKDENGKEINCTILYETNDTINGKAYIAYTDYVKDDDGKYRIIIAELINDGDYKVIPILDKDIEEAIKKQVNSLFIK